MNKTSPIWHPLTQHALGKPEIFIERAEGMWLHAAEGRRILDGISSWWVITHGHCHPRIVEAVQEQAAKLDQVIFAGFTHEPAEKLAEKLLAFAKDSLGPGLEHIFFSDSGSTAVEVALKMAIGYWERTQPPRKRRLWPGNQKRRVRIVTLEHGYHGDTFGGMSLSDFAAFETVYEDFFFHVDRIPPPYPGHEQDAFSHLEGILKTGEVAAFIFEPLVMGAGGMIIYEPEALKIMHDLCRRYGALTIADEVMTGFGRTGTKFACTQAGIVPDLMCLSKGLTGGFLPMGATLASAAIYEAFYHEDRRKMFAHSTSFTGNPLSCAAALASLQIWDEEPVEVCIEAIARSHEKAVQKFKGREDVVDARHRGTILAFEVKDDLYHYFSALGPKLYQYFMERDVLLRPLGNTVYILPPYCITQEELDRIYDVIWRSLDFLRDEGHQ